VANSKFDKDYNIEDRVMYEIWEEQKKNEPVLEERSDSYYYRKAKESILRYQLENPEKHLLQKAKQSAKRLEVPFDISFEDIVIPEYCPYMKVRLTNERGRGEVPSNATLSRIDISKGFVKGNVEVTCVLANEIKAKATPEQLITFAENILRLYKK
jgi:hypothetical protein